MHAADDFEPPLPNEWVRPIAFIALCVVDLWNLTGWMMSEAPLALRLFMGAITLTFEVLGFNVSAQKARADARQVSVNVRRFWFWALVMCCGWSAFCAHNALVLFTPDMSDMQRAPAYAVLLLAAFIIPLMPWAIERTEQAPKTPANSATGGERQSVSDADFGRPTIGNVGRAALALGAVALQPGAHALAPAAHITERVTAGHTVMVAGGPDQSWREEARALWLGGERNKAKIARAVGRPRETVRRELLSLGA